MIRSLASLLALALLAGIGACDGGEIVVFSPAQAGSAGENHGSAGAAGADNSAGSTSAAGMGGAGSSAGGSGGSGGSGGDTVDTACRTTADCDPSWYCQKQNCSDPGGECLPRPISDDPLRMPVCGCDDNITYWNDTLRKKRGISASTSGECQFGVKPCKSDDACGTDPSSDANLRCSRRLPNPSACGMPGSGQCWVVPSDCTGTSDKQRFLPCPPAPGSPSPACMTTCQAMNSGAPYLDKPPDWVCQ